MTRKTRKTLMTAAINSGNYGADAIQAGTPQAIQTIGLEITPIEGEEIDRELDNGQLGNTPVLMVGTHVKVTGSIELTGSGVDAVTPPAFDVILQAAGFGGADNTTSYDYTRVAENNEKDATFYVYKDGAIHIVTGARLTTTTKLAVGELPTVEFEITGLYGGINSGALPTPDFSGFITPVKVGATNTTFKLGADAGTATELKLLEFELAENNEIAFDENTVEEAVHLTDFKPDGKFVIEAPDLGTYNPFTTALNETQQHLEIVHGTTAANIASIVLPKIQLGRGTYSDKDGRLTYDVPFRVIGNTHTFKFS